VIEERTLQLQHCMYQYSRAIYRTIKDMIDPYGDRESQLESRRAVLTACEQTMERLAKDPLYFAKPDRALFQDIRRYFPITCQAEVAWAVTEGISSSSRIRSKRARSTAALHAVAQRRARASRASARRCRSATTARRTSISKQKPRRSARSPQLFPRRHPQRPRVV
jgi:hypothetical protein